ncbi:hypothetical protein HJFPF1_05665 [Paramyrothecium foliicola]|nr:hypothetical protein HJFPF1_05665 [Paramyrothecium foliicola]
MTNLFDHGESQLLFPKISSRNVVTYEFFDERPGEKDNGHRPMPDDIAPDPNLYMTSSVRMTAGETTWSTEDMRKGSFPRRKVGKWGPNTSWDPIGDIIDSIEGHPTGRKPVSGTL